MAQQFKTPDDLATDMLKKKLVSEGMNPNTPVNAPKFSVWVQDDDGWKLHSGRDSSEGFSRASYPRYKNAILTKNGEDVETAFKGMDDYDLFKSLHFTPETYGRPNYLEGEEEKMWNELNQHFDLPKYEKNKYGFTINDKDRIIKLMKNGVLDGRGFGGWKVKPQDLGPLQRRIK